MMSGASKDRPELERCLARLGEGDTLLVWRLDRLGRSLKHLVEIVEDLDVRGVMFKVLAGRGANIDTSTPSGKLIFSIFAAVAEYEREILRERTIAGIAAARARGRMGGPDVRVTTRDIKRMHNALSQRTNTVAGLCRELGYSRTTIYRYVRPDGTLTPRSVKILDA